MPGPAMPVPLHRRAIRLVIVAILALALLPLLASPASAGEVIDPATEVATEQPTEQPTEAPTAPATEQIRVGAILCLDWSCFEFGDLLDGFTITAIDIDTRETLGTCVTDTSTDFQGCVLEIPFGAHWELTFDEAQTPEGYVYHGSMIAVSDGPYGTMTFIPFHPLVDEEPGHMVVQAALCTDASCDEFARFLDGFLISAVNPETGQEYSECVTDNAQQALDHQCILDVPAKGEVELRWFEDQVPEGYVPFGEPITSGEPAVTTLAFVPEDDADPAPTQAPVTGLPVTGTAGTAGPAGGDHITVALVMMATGLASLGLILARDLRRRTR